MDSLVIQKRIQRDSGVALMVLLSFKVVLCQGAKLDI